jgi:hypothetical protein
MALKLHLHPGGCCEDVVLEVACAMLADVVRTSSLEVACAVLADVVWCKHVHVVPQHCMHDNVTASFCCGCGGLGVVAFADLQ